MRKEYLQKRLTLLKTTPCSFLEATEKSDPSISSKTESTVSSPVQEKAETITLRQRCQETLRFNQWNEEMWSHRYIPTEKIGPRSGNFQPQAPAPYIPKPKKQFKSIQNAWQRRYKKLIDGQEDEEKKKKKEQTWGDEVELFYKQYKNDAKSRFSSRSKYQSSYNGLSSVAVNRFFKLAQKEEGLKSERQERPKSAQLLRSEQVDSIKVNHDPIQLKRGLPFLEVFDIVTKSENINSFLSKKQCQEFANSLTPQLRDLIEQVIAERVIEEFEDQKAGIHSQRIQYLKKKLKTTQKKQKMYQYRVERELESKKRDQDFKKFVKTLYIRLSAECRGSKPVTRFAAFAAATLPKKKPYTAVSRTRETDHQKSVEISKSSRTVLRQLSHMAFKRSDLEQIFHKGKSISELRSSSIMETANVREKSVDVPRCSSCREELGETTFSQYSGGPRKEKIEKTAQEKSSWVRNMAVLKIQRFFRHSLSKRKLRKIMEKNEQEKLEEEDFFEKKRSKIRLMKELSSSTRILQVLHHPELEEKTVSEPPILNRYNQRESAKGFPLSSQQSQQRFEVKSKLYDDAPAEQITRKDEVLKIFQKKIDSLNINLERRIDKNRFPRRTQKRGNVLMDRVARIRQRDLLKAAKRNDLDYMKRLSKVIKPWDFRAQDQEGNTVLVLAAQNGSVEMLKYALQRGKHQIEVNHHNREGFTALHYAMMNSDQDELILILLTRGADPGAVNLKGETPLFYASEYLLHRLGMWKLPVEKTETKTSTSSQDKIQLFSNR